MLDTIAYLTPTNLLTAILFAIAAWWCVEIVKRLPNDLEELRNSQDPDAKRVIVFFWLITLLPLWYCVDFTLGIVGSLTGI